MSESKATGKMWVKSIGTSLLIMLAFLAGLLLPDLILYCLNHWFWQFGP